MIIILWLAFLPGLIFGWATQGLFKEFPNYYFVETGCFEGDGIIEATRANFSEIHSIELSEHYYSLCTHRFSYLPRVHLWLGDSSLFLETLIQGFDKPITFWLDGHFSGSNTAKGEINCPILKELEAIKNHPIKTHTILIDDVRLFGTEEFDGTLLSTVIQKLLEINPNYQISFRNGYQPGDILVAIPPKS